MQIKRIASAVAVAGMLTIGSGAAAMAAPYPPSQVLPTQKAAPVKVVSPPANRPVVKSNAPEGDQLAYTGSDALIGAAAGALLILGGAGAVMASRRRATN
ncbi:MAG: LPXTG cell wall anchor domain-containing protein [Propionibacteriaceae bacterium]|nr:LPXTG cell wall anchor domain-containing protein [Propionibacteriaceae bacterium]